MMRVEVSRIFALVVNQIDEERGIPGITVALDPWGKVLAEARPDREDLLVANFQNAALGQRRAVAETFFTHFRRPELYGRLT
jgi:predicted amidohydrolase